MNSVLVHHEGPQDAAQAFNAWAIFVLVALAGLIWFFARPGGPTRSKLAAVSAAAAGGLALLINVMLAQLWFHNRPFVGHPKQTLLLIHHPADNSFPSDHASLAFAIAFTVLAYHRSLGALLPSVPLALALTGSSSASIIRSTCWPACSLGLGRPLSSPPSVDRA